MVRTLSHQSSSSHDLKSGVRTRTGVTARDFAAQPKATRHKRKDGEVSVLVVEDNLVNQRVTQKQLRNAGFVVSVANHGGEALDQLRQTSHWRDHGEDGKNVKELNVVLMDQEMPVMNGVTATRQIREWQSTGELVRHVPIIAVTANARQEQIDALIEAGMVSLSEPHRATRVRANRSQDDVVAKPFTIPQLIPKIEELAARYPADAAPSS